VGGRKAVCKKKNSDGGSRATKYGQGKNYMQTHIIINSESHLQSLTIFTSRNECNAENTHHPREDDQQSIPAPANPTWGRPAPETKERNQKISLKEKSTR
jgi:hypothetical protein